MRSYNTGNAELDEAVDALIELATDSEGSSNADLVRELIVTSLKTLSGGTERGDVKLMNSTLKELRYSFLIFQGYRDVPKVTMYGSARVESHDPNYELAARFAKRMVDQHGWMVVTGAGPGIIMEIRMTSESCPVRPFRRLILYCHMRTAQGKSPDVEGIELQL